MNETECDSNLAPSLAAERRREAERGEQGRQSATQVPLSADEAPGAEAAGTTTTTTTTSTGGAGFVGGPQPDPADCHQRVPSEPKPISKCPRRRPPSSPGEREEKVASQARLLPKSVHYEPISARDNRIELQLGFKTNNNEREPLRFRLVARRRKCAQSREPSGLTNLRAHEWAADGGRRQRRRQWRRSGELEEFQVRCWPDLAAVSAAAAAVGGVAKQGSDEGPGQDVSCFRVRIENGAGNGERRCAVPRDEQTATSRAASEVTLYLSPWPVGPAAPAPSPQASRGELDKERAPASRTPPRPKSGPITEMRLKFCHCKPSPATPLKANCSEQGPANQRTRLLVETTPSLTTTTTEAVAAMTSTNGANEQRVREAAGPSGRANDLRRSDGGAGASSSLRLCCCSHDPRLSPARLRLAAAKCCCCCPKRRRRRPDCCTACPESRPPSPNNGAQLKEPDWPEETPGGPSGLAAAICLAHFRATRAASQADPAGGGGGGGGELACGAERGRSGSSNSSGAATNSSASNIDDNTSADDNSASSSSSRASLNSCLSQSAATTSSACSARRRARRSAASTWRQRRRPARGRHQSNSPSSSGSSSSWCSGLPSAASVASAMTHLRPDTCSSAATAAPSCAGSQTSLATTSNGTGRRARRRRHRQERNSQRAPTWTQRTESPRQLRRFNYSGLTAPPASATNSELGSSSSSWWSSWSSVTASDLRSSSRRRRRRRRAPDGSGARSEGGEASRQAATAAAAAAAETKYAKRAHREGVERGRRSAGADKSIGAHHDEGGAPAPKPGGRRQEASGSCSAACLASEQADDCQATSVGRNLSPTASKPAGANFDRPEAAAGPQLAQAVPSLAAERPVPAARDKFYSTTSSGSSGTRPQQLAARRRSAAGESQDAPGRPLQQQQQVGERPRAAQVDQRNLLNPLDFVFTRPDSGGGGGGGGGLTPHDVRAHSFTEASLSQASSSLVVQLAATARSRSLCTEEDNNQLDKRLRRQHERQQQRAGINLMVRKVGDLGRRMSRITRQAFDRLKLISSSNPNLAPDERLQQSPGGSGWLHPAALRRGRFTSQRNKRADGCGQQQQQQQADYELELRWPGGARGAARLQRRRRGRNNHELDGAAGGSSLSLRMSQDEQLLFAPGGVYMGSGEPLGGAVQMELRRASEVAAADRAGRSNSLSWLTRPLKRSSVASYALFGAALGGSNPCTGPPAAGGQSSVAPPPQPQGERAGVQRDRDAALGEELRWNNNQREPAPAPGDRPRQLVVIRVGQASGGSCGGSCGGGGSGGLPSESGAERPNHSDWHGAGAPEAECWQKLKCDDAGPFRLVEPQVAAASASGTQSTPARSTLEQPQTPLAACLSGQALKYQQQQQQQRQCQLQSGNTSSNLNAQLDLLSPAGCELFAQQPGEEVASSSGDSRRVRAEPEQSMRAGAGERRQVSSELPPASGRPVPTASEQQQQEQQQCEADGQHQASSRRWLLNLTQPAGANAAGAPARAQMTIQVDEPASGAKRGEQQKQRQHQQPRHLQAARALSAASGAAGRLGKENRSNSLTCSGPVCSGALYSGSSSAGQLSASAGERRACESVSKSSCDVHLLAEQTSLYLAQLHDRFSSSSHELRLPNAADQASPEQPLDVSLESSRGGQPIWGAEQREPGGAMAQQRKGNGGGGSGGEGARSASRPEEQASKLYGANLQTACVHCQLIAELSSHPESAYLSQLLSFGSIKPLPVPAPSGELSECARGAKEVADRGAGGLASVVASAASGASLSGAGAAAASVGQRGPSLVLTACSNQGTFEEDEDAEAEAGPRKSTAIVIDLAESPQSGGPLEEAPFVDNGREPDDDKWALRQAGPTIVASSAMATTTTTTTTTGDADDAGAESEPADCADEDDDSSAAGSSSSAAGSSAAGSSTSLAESGDQSASDRHGSSGSSSAADSTGSLSESGSGRSMSSQRGADSGANDSSASGSRSSLESLAGEPAAAALDALREFKSRKELQSAAAACVGGPEEAAAGGGGETKRRREQGASRKQKGRKQSQKEKQKQREKKKKKRASGKEVARKMNTLEVPGGPGNFVGGGGGGSFVAANKQTRSHSLDTHSLLDNVGAKKQTAASLGSSRDGHSRELGLDSDDEDYADDDDYSKASSMGPAGPSLSQALDGPGKPANVAASATVSSSGGGGQRKPSSEEPEGAGGDLLCVQVNKSARSRSVDISLPAQPGDCYVVRQTPGESAAAAIGVQAARRPNEGAGRAEAAGKRPARGKKFIQGEIRVPYANGESRALKLFVDWDANAVNGEHLWVYLGSSSEACYVGESECLKHGPRLSCSACKITAHTGCIGILAEKIKFICKHTFKDLSIESQRHQKELNQNVIYHHWVHKRTHCGRCKQCTKTIGNTKLPFSSKEIQAITCSWCKVSYHNKENCYTLSTLTEPCTLGAHRESIIPPSWIVKLPAQDDSNDGEDKVQASNTCDPDQRQQPGSNLIDLSSCQTLNEPSCEQDINSEHKENIEPFKHRQMNQQSQQHQQQQQQQQPQHKHQEHQALLLQNRAATTHKYGSSATLTTDTSGYISAEGCNLNTPASGPNNATSSNNNNDNCEILIDPTALHAVDLSIINQAQGQRLNEQDIALSQQMPRQDLNRDNLSSSYSLFDAQQQPQYGMQLRKPQQGVNIFKHFKIIPQPISGIPNAGSKPVLVFVNPRSGGNQGAKMMQKYNWLLNPRQVFDLIQSNGPRAALELYRDVPNLRILTIGGDGTASWILSHLDDVGASNRIPVAVLPLGTGNDLARALGWGGGYADEPIAKILAQVREGEIVQLDRWNLHVERNHEATPSSPNEFSSTGSGANMEFSSSPSITSSPSSFYGNTTTTASTISMLDQASNCDMLMTTANNLSGTNALSSTVLDEAGNDRLPMDVINNYFSFGVDAHIALEFHTAREAHPERFNSRLRNKMFYGQAGGKDLLKRKWKDLSNFVTLYCDGQDMTSRLKELKVHSVLFLNIPSYGGGTRPWPTTATAFAKPRTDDGLIEVIGLTTYQLPLLQAGGHGTCIAQCRHAKIITSRTIPMQVDGEPCKLLPSIITISFKNRVCMLSKSKSTSHSQKFNQ